MSNPWIPKHLRYGAKLFCSKCVRETRHDEVIHGRWRCESCRSCCYFEDESDIGKFLPKERSYVLNQVEHRFEPKE